MAVVSLPDDLLREILDRVEDVAVLFRCATACKLWRGLVVDPSFLQRRWPDQDACHSFVGFIAKDKRHGKCKGGNGLVIPGPRSGLDPGCRALGSFMTATYSGLLNGAVPLASRHGRLLVRLGSGLADLDQTSVHMAVCNLLTNTWTVLPPLNLRSADDYEWCGYAILTDVDCCRSSYGQTPNNSAFFKVLVIGSDENKIGYSLYTISHRNASWRTRINCLSVGQNHGSFRDFMVRRGMAHWLYCGSWFYLITFNIQSGHISYKKLDMPTNYRGTSRPCLALGVEGTLSLLWMYKASRQLEILVQQPEQQYVGSNSQWLCNGTIELKQPGEEETGEREWYILGEKCGAMLVIDSRLHVYTVELETGTMEEVLEWTGNCGTIPFDSMPLEMDWKAFFISRLGIRDSMHHLPTHRDGLTLESRKRRRRNGGMKSTDHDRRR